MVLYTPQHHFVPYSSLCIKPLVSNFSFLFLFPSHRWKAVNTARTTLYMNHDSFMLVFISYQALNSKEGSSYSLFMYNNSFSGFVAIQICHVRNCSSGWPAGQPNRRSYLWNPYLLAVVMQCYLTWALKKLHRWSAPWSLSISMQKTDTRMADHLICIFSTEGPSITPRRWVLFTAGGKNEP